MILEHNKCNWLSSSSPYSIFKQSPNNLRLSITTTKVCGILNI